MSSQDVWASKLIEMQIKAFLYSIGGIVSQESPSNISVEYNLQLTVYGIQWSYVCEDDYCSLDMPETSPELNWDQFNEKLQVELCDGVLSRIRTLIKSALTEVEFPEEGVLELLKEKLPILFAE